ncbi:MAG TPA: MtnX-like HAD-IB family phosphatase [Actinomycetota bacterium]
MLPVRAIVVDFDGTANTHDVSEHLLDAFGDPSWPIYDEKVDAGEMGLREAMHIQAAMLRGTREEMLAHALEHCPLDPTFPPFVAWAAGHGVPVSLASDGYGFYIDPILEASGLSGLEVITNEMTFAGNGGPPALSHPNGHPVCIGCGTCKMLAVQRTRADARPVAFVGEGQSDRYGALYADLVFAKLALVPICEHDGVPFLPYETFDDIRDALERLDGPPGAVAPAVCPGWTTP